jgi:localization factor PodJL
MSTSNRSGVGAEPGRSPADVRERLQHLAGMMGPSRQRSGDGARPAEARRGIEHRLAGLAAQAEGARDRLGTSVTPDVGATLERIGSGMAGLARDAAVAAGELHEPWDQDAADALARLYEPEQPTPVPVALPPTSRPTAVTTPAPSAKSIVAGHSDAAPMPARGLATRDDQAWLDERLATLGRKVEAALAAADPAKGFAALDARIDRFETRFGDALERLERHADPAPLKLLEGQLSDLRTHVEATHEQLGRLDGIEQQLRALDGLVRVPAATDQPRFDADALVAKLSERLASDRTTALAATTTAEPGLPAETPGLAELRQALDGFIADQRQAQQQTAGTLGTMQEALIRLIDRIEEVEAQADDDLDAAPRAAHLSEPTPSAGGFVMVEDERGTTPGRRASDAQASASSHAARMAPVAAPPPAAPAAPAARAEAPAEPSAGMVAKDASIAAEAAATVERQPRNARTLATRAPALVDAPEVAKAAAEAMAAERAKVAAGRQAAVLGAAARPSAARGPASAAPRAGDAPSPAAPRPTRTLSPGQSQAPTPGAAQRGLRIAGIAALLIGLSTASFMLVDRYGPRWSSQPAARPIVIAPSDAPRTVEGGPVRLDPAIRPTPAIQRVPDDQPAARELPAAPPLRAPDAGSDTGRPRPTPETVTEDLSQAPREAPSLASTAASRPAQAGMTGIILDGPGLPNPAELARRLAPAAAPAVATPPPNAPLPAADRPTAALPDPAPQSASARPALVEMPPAQIGPMSLRIAAQQGDPAAQFEVAARFAEAKGVKQDFEQAHLWYQRAAQRGFIPAQYRLATLIERGLGTTADLTRAKAWYRRAADQGNIRAMHNLAVLSTTETPDAPDYATAAKWFQQAAERGLADSQYNLAVLHDNGLGVGKDPMQAYLWYALAARAGDKEAAKRRDQIFTSLTPGQTRDAERMVANWRPRPTEAKANDARAAANAFKAEQEQMQAQMNRLQAEAMARHAADQAAAPQPAPQPKATPTAVRPAPITTRAVPMPAPLRP